MVDLSLEKISSSAIRMLGKMAKDIYNCKNLIIFVK